MISSCLGALVLIASLSGPLSENVWILGSFQEKANAVAAQNRLSRALDTETFVITNAETGIYRVVAPEQDLTVEQVSELGDGAWLQRTHDQIEAEGIMPLQLSPDSPNEKTEVLAPQ